MKRNTIWLAISLAALGAGTAAAQNTPSSAGYRGDSRYPAGQVQTVRCDSIDSRQVSCRIEPGSDVRLIEQRSRNPCVRGRTWDYSNSRITVTDGCRADFMVTSDSRWNDDDRGGRHGDNRDGRDGDGRYGDNRTGSRWGQVHCASRSRSSARTYCGTSSSDYTIVGRSANCVEGRTWGNARRGVWVSGKCSANFRISSSWDGDRDRRGDNSDGRRHDAFARSLRCESTGSGRTYCGDAREGPYTLRDSGNRYCVQGSTWGNDVNGLWVSGQCRAQFDRTYRDDETRHDMAPYDRGMVQSQDD